MDLGTGMERSAEGTGLDGEGYRRRRYGWCATRMAAHLHTGIACNLHGVRVALRWCALLKITAIQMPAGDSISRPLDLHGAWQA